MTVTEELLHYGWKFGKFLKIMHKNALLLQYGNTFALKNHAHNPADVAHNITIHKFFQALCGSNSMDNRPM